MQKRKPGFPLLTILLLCFLGGNAGAQHVDTPRPRIVITADPELDDNNSLIRFLLYSTDLEIEGLIYASSKFHWKGDGKGTKWFVPGREYDRPEMDECPCTSWRWADEERFIHEVVEAYEAAYPNLKVHHPGYPAPGELHSKIRYGNIEFDGDISKDTPGSDLIKSLILDTEPGPLFLAAWGGHSTIARALISIEQQYGNAVGWPDLKRKISRKVILLPSDDQDDTYALYIRPNWPDIEYRQFQESPNYGYGAQIRASPENAPYLTAEWMKTQISDRGPLGGQYRVWGDGKQMVEGDVVDYFGLSGYTDAELREIGYLVWMPVQLKGSWLSEGDNHTFMNMLDNGLRAYEAATYGGWGGRAKVGQGILYPFSAPPASSKKEDEKPKEDGTGWTMPDFFPAAQRDFAARMQWSVTPNYADANHAPEATIQGPLNLLVLPGQEVSIHGRVTDPDGDQVSVNWQQFQVGSYPSAVAIENADTLEAKISVPEDAVSGQTIHVVFAATDDGAPALTRYQRVVLRVK